MMMYRLISLLFSALYLSVHLVSALQPPAYVPRQIRPKSPRQHRCSDRPVTFCNWPASSSAPSSSPLSVLFSSPNAAANSGSNGESSKSPKNSGWRGKLNPIPRVRRTVAAIIAFQAQFRARFAALPKKAKLLVLAQLMAMGLVCGAVGRKAYMQGRSVTAATRPVEVPYSVFMDLAEQSGRGHAPGKNPAIMIDNVVIGRDRVGFRVSQDEVKHQAALRDNKLVEKEDVAVRPVNERKVYAMKPQASQDMIDFLRGNGIPFRAASTKGSNTAAVLARSAIFLVYVLFLLRMYRAMSGGGGSDTPGKLALSMDDETIVRFEDIEGIDKAKFEVMEFVDTLRHPQKYAMLGARPPTGLLLEGPPGTGRY